MERRGGGGEIAEVQLQRLPSVSAETLRREADQPTERFEASFRKVGVTAWDGSLTNRERGF